jgi:hypothetical protein
MGVNPAALRSPHGPPGGPGRWSAPRRRVLFVNTHKGEGKSAKVHESIQIRSKTHQNLVYGVGQDFKRIMKLVS